MSSSTITQPSTSRLPRPNLIRQPPRQTQLRFHITPTNRIPSRMTRKPTLRTNTHPLQRLPHTLSTTLRNKLRSLQNPPLHLLQILQRRKFTRNDAQNHILVFRERLQRFEAAGARGVVFEVVRVDVEVLEEFLGDAVVAAFGEVAAVDEVAAADVVHVGGALGDAGVVEGDVRVEGLVCGFGVEGVAGPAGEHFLGAEV